MLTRFAAALAILFTATTAATTDDFWFPGADYDPAVPTQESVIGHATGERISSHGEMIRYMEALAAFAPDRVKLLDYGRTWEGRRLVYAVISSPENIAKLDEFADSMRALADPRITSKVEADRMAAELPGSVWLAYGVHGNEISSTDAAMKTAYHLLASRGDERVQRMLANTMIFINPLQNPDGRDRFVSRFRSTVGLVPDSDKLSAEHNEPWPNGRTNHYLFDMNRDWLALTQPETQGHVAALQNYRPLVVVDLHEMGDFRFYYFGPSADPYNPHMPDYARSTMETIGKTNAKWFDRFGFEYYTREIFDAFYPGYGDSWPAFQGAVSMTYEQGSSRGLVVRRLDGSEMTYADTVRGHFTSSLGTIEAVADNREKFLKQFYTFGVTGIENGEKDRSGRYRIFPADSDRGTQLKLVQLLIKHGIEVFTASKSFTACRARYPAGTVVVDGAQPKGQMVRTLLNEQVDMDPEWVKEQERRRAARKSHAIYDVTAWSLPKQFNISLNSCGSVPSGVLSDSDYNDDFNRIVGNDSTVAYVAKWGDTASARLLTAALREGLAVKSSDLPFTASGVTYPAGSLVFEVKANPDGLADKLAELADKTGASVTGLDSTWVTDGPNFGSNNMVKMHAPKIAIAWDEQTSALSAGNTRFVIERQFGYPVTAIRTRQLAGADLSRYQVLILPAGGFGGGGYAGALGKRGAENIKNWVRRGGVLIAQSTAMRWVADPSTGLSQTRREIAVLPEGVEKASSDEGKKTRVDGSLIESAEDFANRTAAQGVAPDSVPGAMAYVSVDTEHWLGAGVKDTLSVQIRGSDIYTPLRLDQGVNVAHFKAADDLLSSGYLWEENRKQLAFKPFVTVEPMGRGMVIGFTQEPTFRAYMDGLNMIYMNAIFRGAAHAFPTR